MCNLNNQLLEVLLERVNAKVNKDIKSYLTISVSPDLAKKPFGTKCKRILEQTDLESSNNKVVNVLERLRINYKKNYEKYILRPLPYEDNVFELLNLMLVFDFYDKWDRNSYDIRTQFARLYFKKKIKVGKEEEDPRNRYAPIMADEKFKDCLHIIYSAIDPMGLIKLKYRLNDKIKKRYTQPAESIPINLGFYNIIFPYLGFENGREFFEDIDTRTGSKYAKKFGELNTIDKTAGSESDHSKTFIQLLCENDWSFYHLSVADHHLIFSDTIRFFQNDNELQISVQRQGVPDLKGIFSVKDNILKIKLLYRESELMAYFTLKSEICYQSKILFNGLYISTRKRQYVFSGNAVLEKADSPKPQNIILRSAIGKKTDKNILKQLYKYHPAINKNMGSDGNIEQLRQILDDYKYDYFLAMPVSIFTESEMNNTIIPKVEAFIKHFEKFGVKVYFGPYHYWSKDEGSYLPITQDQWLENENTYFSDAREMLVIYPSKEISGVLIELGWALKEQKNIYIYTKSDKYLPYFLRVNRPDYCKVNFSAMKNILTGTKKNQATYYVKCLEQVKNHFSHIRRFPGVEYPLDSLSQVGKLANGGSDG